ncbi:hypothetical protein CHISP_0561 [Chitinispirillum alkaliphilum]|nr:hypothetical protein CHISP_0561 [Chitinispirillum alkaliphilum]
MKRKILFYKKILAYAIVFGYFILSYVGIKAEFSFITHLVFVALTFTLLFLLADIADRIK